MNRQMSGERPEKCPLVQTCEERVVESWLKYRCCSRDWFYCLPPKVNEQTEKYKRPRDWLKKISGEKLERRE